MTKIRDLIGRAVYDSNGIPAIEAEVVLEGGRRAWASAPRGSTTGDYEAALLEDASRSPGLACVEPALRVLAEEVRPALVGQSVEDQTAIDLILVELDGTTRKERLGGNVCVAVSMAAAAAGAGARGLPLHEHLSGGAGGRLPTPMFNILDGSRARGSGVGGIEFLLIPPRDTALDIALEMGSRVRSAARQRLAARGLTGGDSAQGALEALLATCEEGFDIVCEAAESCGYQPGENFWLGADLAAADYWAGSKYAFPWCKEGEQEWPGLLPRYERWLRGYPMLYLEDAFSEHDPAPWIRLTASAGASRLIVGDDLFASSAARIRTGAEQHWANGTLVKPNQVGTVTEALEAMRIAADAQFCVVVSQRSGENETAFITHLAVAGAADYLKAGGMSRMDRIMKYNELLRMADRLG
jgi:enolase